MNQTNQDNQLTLHELVHKGKEVAAYVKNKWLLLVGALIIGSVIGICYALFKKTNIKHPSVSSWPSKEEEAVASALTLASHHNLGLI
ncbi:hypothetical protein QT327_23085 [Olivibacter sp. 47]|uniref:hypothetical protein n=1 Tax=Olivibacter sp. 47 TaxID=3056486 RepID=UPI0025A336FF|nr:hypothetical protein [Olivibacter sp. 47]MDM8177198.1 hypothetical protein [Olivibacter sp. 47]